MDIGLLISGIVGSAGFFTFLEFMIRRHDHKTSPLEDVKKELEKNTELTLKVRDEAKDFNLRITRLELLDLIKLDPNNRKAITEVARHYFCDLDGDWYMHDLFQKWADEQGVSTIGLIKQGGHNGTENQN